jgi:CheY-like chemotaxis protein
MNTPRPGNLPDLSGLTLLIVEDNDDHLQLLMTYLGACRAHVVFARNAAAALAYVESAPRLDAAITDLSMPSMDGAEFARRVRQHPRRSRLPIIALTAFYEDYPRTADFNAYLRKPVDFDELCNTIRTLVERP